MYIIKQLDQMCKNAIKFPFAVKVTKFSPYILVVTNIGIAGNIMCS